MSAALVQTSACCASTFHNQIGLFAVVNVSLVSNDVRVVVGLCVHAYVRVCVCVSDAYLILRVDIG